MGFYSDTDGCDRCQDSGFVIVEKPYPYSRERSALVAYGPACDECEKGLAIYRRQQEEGLGGKLSRRQSRIDWLRRHQNAKLPLGERGWRKAGDGVPPPEEP